ncbi:MAG: hypothetical protein [Podoviridae sp. ctda_1]|nr:MAG: hypothetical protein [Podoviridae sp. ctda_1]
MPVAALGSSCISCCGRLRPCSADNCRRWICDSGHDGWLPSQRSGACTLRCKQPHPIWRRVERFVRWQSRCRWSYYGSPARSWLRPKGAVCTLSGSRSCDRAVAWMAGSSYNLPLTGSELVFRLTHQNQPEK